jgi:hypothetical protein
LESEVVEFIRTSRYEDYLEPGRLWVQPYEKKSSVEKLYNRIVYIIKKNTSKKVKMKGGGVYHVWKSAEEELEKGRHLGRITNKFHFIYKFDENGLAEYVRR